MLYWCVKIEASTLNGCSIINSRYLDISFGKHVLKPFKTILGVGIEAALVLHRIKELLLRLPYNFQYLGSYAIF